METYGDGQVRQWKVEGKREKWRDGRKRRLSEIMIKGLKNIYFLASRHSYPCSSANQQNFHRESEGQRE